MIHLHLRTELKLCTRQQMIFLNWSLSIDWLFQIRKHFRQFTFIRTKGKENDHFDFVINFSLLNRYVYISAYYDAQHSLVYRSLLDGSNLETFITLNYPVLGMTLDYRHPRLYVMLSNGDIESYATDASQPWKTRIYSFKSTHLNNCRSVGWNN